MMTSDKTSIAGMDTVNDLQWFIDNGHWVIRKVPNTKDQFYVAAGDPPARILKIYGIALDWFEK